MTNFIVYAFSWVQRKEHLPIAWHIKLTKYIQEGMLLVQ
jgi:hypothetical protein